MTLGKSGPYSLSAVFGPRPGVLAEVGEPLRTHYLLPMLAGEKRLALDSLSLRIPRLYSG